MKAIALVVIVLLGRAAAAQTQPPTLEGLAGKVSVNEKFVVKTFDGREVSGHLRSLTAESITLQTRKEEMETIRADRIARIVAKDRLKNGISIGAAAGAGAGLIGALTVGAICSNEGSGCAEIMLGLIAAGAGGGAAIGAGLDAMRNRTVFASPLTPGAPGVGAVTRTIARSKHLASFAMFGVAPTRSLSMRGGVGIGIAW